MKMKKEKYHDHSTTFKQYSIIHILCVQRNIPNPQKHTADF